MAVEYLGRNAPDGMCFGLSSSELVGFYGTTPVAQRASATQAASLVSANSWISVTSNMGAFAAEVAATLTGMGLWKGGA